MNIYDELSEYDPNRGLQDSIPSISSTLGSPPLLQKTGPIQFSFEEPFSSFRHVFQTTDQMKNEFVKFLKTIFFQLDEKKVLSLMEKLLEDPNKTDEQIYKELLAQIHTTKKWFPRLLQLWSLFVLKKGMGKQAAELTKDFRKDKFHDCMEIYDRRYLETIRKTTKMPLDGAAIAVCNEAKVGFRERLEAGAVFSKYPYKQCVPLNEEACEDPLLQPELTYKPLGDEVEDNSVDFIAALGGLHHVPADKVDAFTDSLRAKLRPGGVLLLREHNVADSQGAAQLPHKSLYAIASVVHTFVNAADGISWDVESKEVRNFESLEEWTEFMQAHGFTRISAKSLVLKDDPTENAMMAFVKTPETLEEMRQAISYRNDYQLPKHRTRATWIEWGNVRFSKQYAEYVQNHHDYAFDYIGHMRQHWTHFYHYVKESLKDESLKDLLFSSSDMAMNLFILVLTSVQCSLAGLANFPSACYARWKHGENWRNVCNLTDLEKFYADNAKEYADFLDLTPFYMYPYMTKMKEMWKVVWNSQESWATKLSSAFSATLSSIGFMAQALASLPASTMYKLQGNTEPAIVKLLIKDPHNEIGDIIERFNAEKKEDEKGIEVVLTSRDGYKLVSVPPYESFTKISKYLAGTKQVELLEISGRDEISVDVLYNKEDQPEKIEGTEFVYELDLLQDESKRRYTTYQVKVAALRQFHQILGDKVKYIHE